jgi:hypothetical protein
MRRGPVAPGPSFADAAIVVAPNNVVTTSAQRASLDRMGLLLIHISDAGVRTYERNERSLSELQMGAC